MLTWVLAVAAGVAAAVWSYGARPSPLLGVVAALLRAVAVAGLVALILDATFGGRRLARPLVALDVSESWSRGNDTAFAAAQRHVRQGSSSDGLLLFGDSVRIGNAPPEPKDRASRVRPAVERALAAGRPLMVITDGELDDPEALRALSGGSSVVLVPRSGGVDGAVSELRVPRAVMAGDTIAIEVGVVAGAAGAPRGRLSVQLGDRSAVTSDVDSLGAHGERLVPVRLPLATPGGSLVLRAVLTLPGDVEPGNDTLATAIEVSAAAGAVLVSTAPDFDARELASVLRGTLSLPTRGFYRVAPGIWREDGALGPASDDAVRRAAREAPLLVLHGDTTIFGNPRTFARGALLLVAPPSAATGEWYPTGTPPSPMMSALSGSPWDSLPPLDVSPQMPTGTFEVLETRRARRLERRAAAVGWERPRRVVLVGGSGFWRWRFRGGVGSGVHAAFWGSVIDWLSAERADERAAVPVEGASREGRPVRWRRGGPGDTVVAVSLTRQAPPAQDSLVLRFAPGALFAESPPLPAGVYTATVRGGSSALVVNPTAERLPRRPSVQAGPVGSGTVLAEAPRLRGIGWIFAMVIVALCLEWILRRRLGLR